MNRNQTEPGPPTTFSRISQLMRVNLSQIEALPVNFRQFLERVSVHPVHGNLGTRLGS